jgi:hypothetical protein
MLLPKTHVLVILMNILKLHKLWDIISIPKHVNVPPRDHHDITKLPTYFGFGLLFTSYSFGCFVKFRGAKARWKTVKYYR